MTKQLNFPFTVRIYPEDSYAVIKGTYKDTVTLICLDANNLGRVFKDYYKMEQLIEWIEDGSYTVLGLNPITDVPEPEAPTIMALKIETDASSLTDSLGDANEQANKLLNTLRSIKNLFNT